MSLLLTAAPVFLEIDGVECGVHNDSSLSAIQKPGKSGVGVR